MFRNADVFTEEWPQVKGLSAPLSRNSAFLEQFTCRQFQIQFCVSFHFIVSVESSLTVKSSNRAAMSYVDSQSVFKARCDEIKI